MINVLSFLKTSFKFLIRITVVCAVLLYAFSHKVHAASYTWTGAGTDNNWSTCTNWGGTCPVAGDTVTFNGTSTKDSVVDTSFGGSVGVLNISSGYTGTVSLAQSLTVTSTMTQAAGTLAAGNHDLTVTSTYTLSGGTFNAPSTTFYVQGNFAHTGGIFNHNNGTVNFNGEDQTISGSTIFHNFSKIDNTFVLTFTAGTTQTIQNDLRLTGKSPLTRLYLRSSAQGSTWNIDAQGTTRQISNVDVQDSVNLDADIINGDTGSKDAGHNTGWSFPGYQLPAKVIDMADSNNWHIRFDGPAGGYTSMGTIEVADIYGTGEQDILVAAPLADPDGRNCSGSVYIIAHSLYSQITGRGNVVDLNNPNNYTLRIDGPVVSSCTSMNAFGGVGKVKTGDLNRDGKADLILSAQMANHNSRTKSGSVYVIYNELLREKTVNPTGNIIWLGHQTETSQYDNFNVRFDGPGTNNATALLGGYIGTGNLSGDGLDLVMSTWAANYSYSTSGSMYVITATLLRTWSGTGHTIDLETNTNFSLRIDGPHAYNIMGYYFADGIGDLDSDNKDDLIIGVNNIDSSRTFLDSIGGIYIMYNSTLRPKLSGTGNLIDLGAATPPYSILLYTGITRDDLGWSGTYTITDLNNDGKKWLIIGGAYFTSTQNRYRNGVLYLLKYSMLSKYKGTGNTVNLTNSSNFYLRIDGASNNYLIGDMFTTVQDYFSLGNKDLLTGGAKAPSEKYTVRGPSDWGNIYVIPNSKLNNQPKSSGNIMDMANTSNYSVLYQGAPTSANATTGTHLIAPTTDKGINFDLNGDGIQDQLFAAHLTPFTNGAESGSLYVIYKFPHTLTAKRNGNIISGTVTLGNSITNIARVQYSVDNNSPTSSTWKTCTGTTSYTCTLTALSPGTHTIYVRAQDSNGVYTTKTLYKTISISVAADTSVVEDVTASLAPTETPLPSSIVSPEATPSVTNPKPTTRPSQKSNTTYVTYAYVCPGIFIVLIIIFFLIRRRKREKDT